MRRDGTAAETWSSACSEIRPSLHKFFEFIDDLGKADFQDVNLVEPTPEEWYILQCLLLLLEPFLVATEWLSGESYTTLSIAFPTLRSLTLS